MTRNEALDALEQAGLVAKGYFPDRKTTHIRGGRSSDLAGKIPLQVFHKAYDISEQPDGTFTIMHVLDRLDFETNVASLEAAVSVVLTEYRKAGLLP